jgi:hypothetical protein
VLGQPPRPRKDVTCEICAATFLELRLQRLLEGPSAPEPAGPEAGDGVLSDGRTLSAHPHASSPHQPARRRGEPLPPGPPDARAGRWRGPRERSLAGAAPRWALIRFGLGIGCVVAGAAVAAFGGLLWLIIPGYLLVLMGLGLIASGAI